VREVTNLLQKEAKGLSKAWDPLQVLYYLQ